MDISHFYTLVWLQVGEEEEEGGRCFLPTDILDLFDEQVCRLYTLQNVVCTMYVCPHEISTNQPNETNKKRQWPRKRRRYRW